MIYEIREYTTVPGRMQALVNRFNDHTMKLFAKHSVEVVFISLTELGDNSNNELVYVLKFDSYADMADKWARFVADPEWITVKAESEADGPIIAKMRRRMVSPAAFA
ncbi:NIPSNAP family protein [Nocardia terpenica]|uniref:NIPSNAP family protein n=1 Tax=Nocardia terpenica TaxID=455432 RepID=UPI001894EA65|nr:NIPSNAP family protein [Nocardia terpenica]MBF6061098.1 NIPSNAP family protein [Nocardia terpenica]MBF6105673.1 NIPSNAP family protein [Nocardia terpenica]MBF6112857.1 NIPSNAP family protein [Nocardia terpenica]MBF6118987.1 NIPSNAP family protein [Nocardia terpenica]